MNVAENKTVAIVTPVFNEEENLNILYERARAVFEQRPEDLHFIFVDDGSTDGGFQKLVELRKRDPAIRVVRLSRNFGHQAAVTAGLHHSCEDAVVIMDADLQDPPEVIPELLAEWERGAQVVYGVRNSRSGEGFFKRAFASVFYRVFHRLCDIDMPLDAGDFRLLDRKVVQALSKMGEQHRYLRGMTSWVGFQQSSVKYSRDPRNAGETKYPFWKSLKLAWDGVTSFSARPLQWVTGLGLAIALVSAVFAARIIYIKMFDPASMVSGWASLSVLILFLGGVQLASIGILGQYVCRIFEESKKRPNYIVAESLGWIEEP